MKKIILAVILSVLASVYVFGQEQVSLTFSKNSSGELILTVTGHTAPIDVIVGSNKITLHVKENIINLSALGIHELTEVSVEEVDTAAGAESSTNTDTQTPIPPVSTSINPNPPLATPY